ncbi:MAG: PEGA domain-containing protein [Planctomycetota bacterium]
MPGRTPATPALCIACAALVGCHDRRIVVTSSPPGALVWLNDREIGRTPAEAAFKFYGDYDVRLELEGHEPLHTEQRAEAPIAEWPGFDLATNLFPGRTETVIEWHFDLEPALELTEGFEQGLLERARATQADALAPAE